MAPKRAEIIAFLDRHPGRAYCDDCLTKALQLSPVDVTMSTANLASLDDQRVAMRKSHLCHLVEIEDGGIDGSAKAS